MRIGGDVINIMIDGNNLTFMNPEGTITTIEGLRLDKAGVIKENPDLKRKKEWRKIAIERFKEHIKRMKSETEVIKYVIDDLKKYGYEPMLIQRAGHRPKRVECH